MRTYIGHNKCSRCGGGSGCYVCNDEPETKTTPENMNEITSQDVAEWMKSKLAEIHEKHDYGHISVEINQHKQCEKKVRFSVYCSPTIKCNDKPTLEDCFAVINSITPAREAAAKREEAAKLLKEAAELEGLS